MDRKDLDRLTFRIHLLGFSITLPFFTVITCVSVLVFFHFDARMFGWYWIAMGIGVAVLAVPYIVAIRSRFRKVDEVLRGTLEEGKGVLLDPRGLLGVERYPVFMGVTAMVILTTGGVLGALVYYFFAEYNGWLSFYYFVTIAAISMTCAYLQAYVVYYVMRPARRMVYGRYGLSRGMMGISLRSRITALAVLFIMVPLIVGWTTSVTIFIFNTQDDLKERGARNTTVLASMAGGDTGEGAYALPEDDVELLALTADETWLLLDGERRRRR